MDDLISRQAAIDALKDMYHAAEKWGKEATDDVIKARAESCMASLIEMKLRIEKLPSAQPQLDTCPIYGGMCGYPSNLCYECPRHEGAKERPQWWTEGLQPFAQPQRIKGRWIHDGYDIPHGVDWMHCSVCGRREPHVPAAITNFCPTCGSDMRGDDDE